MMEIDEIGSELERHIRERFGVPETDAEFNHNVDLFNYGYIDSFGRSPLYSRTLITARLLASLSRLSCPRLFHRSLATNR